MTSPKRFTPALALAAAMLVRAAVCPAQSEVTLDRAAVVDLATSRSPEVRSAEARVSVAEARRTGGDMLVRENPTLSLWAGPRQLVNGEWIPDATFSLSWPFDLSGSRGARGGAVSAGVRVALADARTARRRAVFEALSSWTHCLEARARLTLERSRLAVEETALRIANARRANGAAGDDEPALATTSLAMARARVQTADGELAAAQAELRAHVGLGPDAPVALEGTLTDTEPSTLEALLGGLTRRADVARASSGAELARADADLQRRLGWPLPRVGVGFGRENEYYGRLGVELALPFFQRNQTAVAVARAEAAASGVERETLLACARAELRAAYARHEAARAAFATLDEALPSAALTERLATRSFELGQRDLAATLVVLREAAAMRVAHLEAAVAVAHSRVEVELAAGVW